MDRRSFLMTGAVGALPLAAAPPPAAGGRARLRTAICAYSFREALGKKTRKDVERGKLTWPRCSGIDAARRAAEAFTEEAVDLIRPLDEGGDLEALARFVVARTL